MPRSDKVCRAQRGSHWMNKPEGQTWASREHEKHLSGQGSHLSKHHSYSRQVLNDSQKSQSRCWDWAWPTVVTQSFLQHTRQPEQKLTKNNCWKTECSWNPREQETEFSLGNITEGHSPMLFGYTQLPLAHLELDQTSTSQQQTAVRGQQCQHSQCCLSPEGQGDATDPQHPLCKERRRQHCPFNSNWLNLTLKNSGFNL